jgi:hypothetical protein
MREPDCRFVQFPHPGGEHHPATDDMPWNVAPHRRKFLLSPGRYLDAHRRVRTGQLVVWGEWEPPSQIVRRWPREERLARALHRPYWIQPDHAGPRQNTDPWIWGTQMLYSNCKQIAGPHRVPTSMQDLPTGSVICFGSTIEGQFCIDTLLVVATREPWVLADAARLHVTAAFKTCTGGSHRLRDRRAHRPHPLPRRDHRPPGARHVQLRPRATRRHPRPPLRPPTHPPARVDQPTNRQSTWGSKRPLSASEVRNAWNEVRRQVLDAGLVFAVNLETLPSETVRTHSLAQVEPAADR